MPYKVMRNFANWREGDVISGGDLKGYVGTEVQTPSRTDQKKLGLTASKGISDERIAELIQRGVLFGIGEDMKVLVPPEIPYSTTTYQERLETLNRFDVSRASE